MSICLLVDVCNVVGASLPNTAALLSLLPKAFKRIEI